MLVSYEVVEQILDQLSDWDTPLQPLSPESLSFWIVVAIAIQEGTFPAPQPVMCVSKIQHQLVSAKIISNQAFNSLVRDRT